MEDINILELLKNCPRGMQIDCLMYDNVTFDRIDVEQNRIYLQVGRGDTIWVTCYGKCNFSPDAKCVIFPKGKTTWENFKYIPNIRISINGKAYKNIEVEIQDCGYCDIVQGDKKAICDICAVLEVSNCIFKRCN